MAKIYLETTALIDAILKGWYPELTGIIEKADRVTTSQYAKMEIKKGFLRNWVLLYNKAVQFQSIDMVHQFISSLSSSPQRYYLGACADAITLFSKSYSQRRPREIIEQYGEANEGEVQLKLFKSLLRTQIKRCFHKVSVKVAEIYNPMNCFNDLSTPVEKYGVFFNKPERCNESGIKCDIKRYIEDNRDAFITILKTLEGLEKQDSETKRRISSLKKMLKMVRWNRNFDNTNPNQKHCWNCGDAIHAVIAGADEQIITRNFRHFEPICGAIGKSIKGYKSPSL
jgi:hypothetical protein